MEEFQYGKSTLKSKIIVQNKKLNAALKNIVEQSSWFIDKGNFNLKQWKQIIQQMTSCDAYSMHIDTNKCTTILKQISHIIFCVLKTLDVSDNLIDNIEPISYINCQNLSALSMRQNNINKLSSFRKWSINSLQWLNVRSNPINELSSLSRTNFNTFKMDRLNLGSQVGTREDNQMLILQDVSIIVKYNSKIIRQICICSKNRIKQIKIQKMLKYKNQELIIHQTKLK